MKMKHWLAAFFALLLLDQVSPAHAVTMLTFSDQASFLSATGATSTGATLNSNSGSEGLEIQIDLSSPVYALGFDYTLHVSTGASDPFSWFTVLISLDTSLLGSFPLKAEDDAAAFLGVWTDSPFDTVEMLEYQGNAENVVFSQFYAGTQPVPQPVPEPGTLALIGTGLLGLAAGGRKKRAP